MTDEEKEVLDASAAIPIDNLIMIAARNGRRMARWARAELARRNGKTGPKMKAAK